MKGGAWLTGTTEKNKSILEIFKKEQEKDIGLSGMFFL